MESIATPLVSIVTATKNRRELLRQLIENILSSSYPRIEHIIVDGLSTDGTVEMLREYEARHPGRVRWMSERDKNQVEAINRGLRMAQGEFVSITHDDDGWLADGIGLLIEEASKHGPADIVYGNLYAVAPDGARRILKRRPYTMDDLVNRGYQAPQDGSLFKRKWLAEVGLLDESVEYVPEHDLFLRIMERGGSLLFVDRMVGTTLVHEGKKSWQGRTKGWDETWRVNRKHGAKLFSVFTAAYIKNKYLNAPYAFLTKTFPGFSGAIKKMFRSPSYENDSEAGKKPN